jgi:hypothetical protein
VLGLIAQDKGRWFADLTKHSSFARRCLGIPFGVDFQDIDEYIVTDCEELRITVSLPTNTTDVQVLRDSLDIARPHEMTLLSNPLTTLGDTKHAMIGMKDVLEDAVGSLTWENENKFSMRHNVIDQKDRVGEFKLYTCLKIETEKVMHLSRFHQ